MSDGEIVKRDRFAVYQTTVKGKDCVRTVYEVKDRITEKTFAIFDKSSDATEHMSQMYEDYYYYLGVNRPKYIKITLLIAISALAIGFIIGSIMNVRI